MHWLLALALAGFLSQSPPVSSGIQARTFQSPDGVAMLYGISIPKNYDGTRPVPLVLVLHPGGERARYYGLGLMRLLVVPALGDTLGPIMIAPDCPTNSWTDAVAERAVMALVEQTLDRYPIDRHRILVTGYSLGGRGTWFMASRHSDLFTAAIPMAASTGNEPHDRLGTIPTYIIHSRRDEVSPFAPAEQIATELAALGRTVTFDAIDGIGHYDMYGYLEALRRAGHWVADRWAKN